MHSVGFRITSSQGLKLFLWLNEFRAVLRVGVKATSTPELEIILAAGLIMFTVNTINNYLLINIGQFNQ